MPAVRPEYHGHPKKSSARVESFTCASPYSVRLQNGRNIMAAAPCSFSQPHPNLSDQASSFLGGVLQSLPALLPFTAPSVNSYDRCVRIFRAELGRATGEATYGTRLSSLLPSLSALLSAAADEHLQHLSIALDK